MSNAATWLDRFFTASSITTAPFTQPAANATVNVTLLENGWLTIGQYAFIASGGVYTVAAISVDGVTVTLTNTGATGNAAPTTVIPALSKITFSGATGPAGPQGIQGNQGAAGPAGTGTSIATATSIGTSGNVPNFGGSPGIIREDIDMSAASQITRTLPTPGNTPNGSIYAAKLINLGTTAQLQPVIFTCTYAMEDPENPGTLAATVKCAVLGDCIWWQRNSNTGLQIIARALPAQVPA